MQRGLGEYLKGCFTGKNNREKRGSIQDIVLVLIVVVVFTVGSLITFKISNELNNKFQNSTDITGKGKVAMSSINNLYPTILDNTFMLLMIGLAIGALVLASLVRIHPASFIFFIVVLGILIFVSGAMSNIYQGIADNENMDDIDGSPLADRLTFMPYAMQYLPFIVGIIGLMMSFIMYKTWQNA